MYYTNNQLIREYSKDSRQLYIRATFNDNSSYVVDGEQIISANITDSVLGSQTLSLGNACSKQLELNMYLPDNFVGLENSKIKLELGIDVGGTAEYTDLGVFYTQNIKYSNNNKSVTITAYDAMLKVSNLGNTYTCGLTASSVKAIDIINDIADQAGIDSVVSANPQPKSIETDCTANNVSYNSNGSIGSPGTDYGVDKSHLIMIPPGVYGNIEWRMYTNTLYTPLLKLCFFSDSKGDTLYDYQELDGLSIGSHVDLSTGEQYELCEITAPVTDKTLYLGFSITCQSEEAKDNTFKVIFSYRGRTFKNTSLSFDNPGTVDISPRTMLGYMAGILGGNAVISRDDKLNVTFYQNTGFNIDLDTQYMGSFEKDKSVPLAVGYLTTGTNENVLTVGNGSYGFNFTNPYISNTSAAQNILNANADLKFVPGTVKFRGNPFFDSGDIVLVEGKDGTAYPLLICTQDFSFSGGFSATLSCNLDTETEQSFVSTPNSQSLTQKFNDFTQQYQAIVGMLSGVTGGYVKFVYDTQNKLRAIAIPDADIDLKWDSDNGKVVAADGSTDTSMWVWCNGGLGYTPDGGATYETALNKNGQFYAGDILSYSGTIGGFHIDDTSLYADNGDYRTYVQSAIHDGKSWAFSVQKLQDGKYYGKWYVTSEGDMYCYEKIFLESNDSEIVSLGNKIALNSKEGTSIRINDSEVFWIGKGTTTVDGTSYNSNNLHSSSTMSINANSKGSPLFLFASYIKLCPANVIQCYGALRLCNTDSVIADDNGTEILNPYRDGDLVIGHGYYSSNYDSKFEGYSVTLNSKSRTIIQLNGSEIFRFGKSTVTSNGSSFSTNLFRSSTTLTIDANDTGSPIFLFATYIKLCAANAIQCYAPFYLNFHASSGTVPLAVNSSGMVTTTSSSERYKENITENLDDDLKPEKLYQLPVKQYNYKEEYKDSELVAGTQIGITAEDVAEIYPNAAIYNDEGQPESWHERIMIPAMLKLIQDQKKEIDDLKSRLDALEKSNN